MMRMILMSVSKHSRGQAGATTDQCALVVLLASRCNIRGFATWVGNNNHPVSTANVSSVLR